MALGAYYVYKKEKHENCCCYSPKGVQLHIELAASCGWEIPLSHNHSCYGIFNTTAAPKHFHLTVLSKLFSSLKRRSAKKCRPVREKNSMSLWYVYVRLQT